MKIFTARPGWRGAGAGLFALSLATISSGDANASAAISASGKEKQCLATAIYFEARGESTEGQKAVAQVVVNRVRDKSFPDTVCGVVYQNSSKFNRCQFSFACDGIADRPSDKRAWSKAQNIAVEVLKAKAPVANVGRSTHYHAVTVRPRWSSRLKRQNRIGRHIFYSA